MPGNAWVAARNPFAPSNASRRLPANSRIPVVLLNRMFIGMVVYMNINQYVSVPQIFEEHLFELAEIFRLLGDPNQGKQMFYAVADAHIRRVIADMVEHDQLTTAWLPPDVVDSTTEQCRDVCGRTGG